MTNDIQQETSTEQNRPPFGVRLKSAREALGLSRKDVAMQLRLNEKVISMIERERYPDDLPSTFIRGYLRSYGKLLQIPEIEILRALEPIQPKVSFEEPLATLQPLEPVGSGNFVQILTYLIIFISIGLVGIWWYTRTPQQTQQSYAEPEQRGPEQQERQQQQSQPQQPITIPENLNTSTNPDAVNPSKQQQQPITIPENLNPSVNQDDVTPPKAAPLSNSSTPAAKPSDADSNDNVSTNDETANTNESTDANETDNSNKDINERDNSASAAIEAE